MVPFSFKLELSYSRVMKMKERSMIDTADDRHQDPTSVTVDDRHRDPIGGEWEVRAALAIEKSAKNSMNAPKSKNIVQKAQ
jgi:hypothetical protein